MPILLTIYLLCSAILVLYGLHHYFIIYLFLRELRRPVTTMDSQPPVGLRKDDPSPTPPEDFPKVLTQIPLYNEPNVAERIIRATAAILYPKHLHTIQILDDSTDHTSRIVDQVVTELAARGHQISAIRRPNRTGYKAGALDHGLTLSDAPYVAIFDSDFVPPENFLTETIPHLTENPNYGLVQARWGFLNEHDSPFTRAQSVGIDGHFVVEQTARAFNDYFLNFNGTAGVWRRTAIDDAGGWNADTLTEDLDLSYRAQLKGWRFHYLPHLVVPAEIPPSYAAFRSQQFRWAKGSMQTALKILPEIWSARAVPLRKKIEATFHLTHYSIHLCMLIHALLGLPLALTSADPFGRFIATWYLVPLALAMLGPSLLYLTAELWIHPTRWKLFLKRLPMLILIGFGICLSNARACIEGLIGIKSPFIRTPKAGDGKIKLDRKNQILPLLELTLALYTTATAIIFIKNDIPAAAPFFLIYATGFTLFAIRSYQETRHRDRRISRQSVPATSSHNETTTPQPNPDS